MSDRLTPLNRAFPISRALEQAPRGTVVCLACGALVLDDVGAIEVHQQFHAYVDRPLGRTLIPQGPRRHAGDEDGSEERGG